MECQAAGMVGGRIEPGNCCLQVLRLTEMTLLRNAMVGVAGVSGLSVEQRKRLTIGVELAANPSILFLDEPTTGHTVCILVIK